MRAPPARSWIAATLTLAATLAATILVLPAWVSPAAAASAPSDAPAVVLLVESCPDVDEQALRAMLALEIGDRLQRAPARGDPAADRLAVRCRGGSARLTAASPRARSPIERTLALDGLADDVAVRLLALAGVELLASLDPGAAAPGVPADDDVAADAATAGSAAESPPPAEAAGAPPPPAPRRSPPVAGPAASQPSPTRARTVTSTLALALVRRVFLGEAGVSAWGGRVGLNRPLRERWVLLVDLEGDASRQSGLGAGATSYLLSLGGLMGTRFGGEDFVGVLAVGARIGLTRFSGDPMGSGFTAGSVTRAWAGPAVVAQVISGSRGRGLLLSVEVGATLLGAAGLADQQVVVAVRGTWVTAGAGFVF